MRGRVGRAVAALIALSCVAVCAARPALGHRLVLGRAQRAAVDASAAQPWPRREVLDLAMQAYRCGETLGYIERPLVTVIDYSLPSSERRLWVIDVARQRVLFHELVAHGQNSGEDVAVAFSNRLGSRQSSLGLFRTEDTYLGEHGISLRLTGLESGINDLARERQIVMHGAPYVSDAYVAQHGRLGRSWGCPAVPADVHEQLIDRIRDGSAVFAYYPDSAWLQSSRFLHCNAQLAKARQEPAENNALATDL